MMPEENNPIRQIADLYGQFRSEAQANDLDHAISLLQEAVEAAGPLDRPALLAALLLKLGQFLLERQGRIQDAVHAFTAGGMRLKDDPQFRSEMHRALNQLQSMRKGYRGSTEALPDIYLLDTDDDLLLAEQDPLLHVKHIFNAGACYLEMGQEEAALGYFREAEQIPSLQQAPFIHAKVQTNLAELLRRQGALAVADQLLEKAQKNFEKSATPPVETREFHAILARLRQQQDRREEAIRRYEQAVALYAGSDDAKGYGRTVVRLAQLYLEEEKWEEARKSFATALALAERTGDDNNAAFAHRGLALCYLTEDQPEKVIEHLEACLRRMHAVVDVLRTEQGKLSRIDSMEGAMNALLDNYLALMKRQEEPGPMETRILRRIDEFHGLVLDDILQGVVRANQQTETVDPGSGELELPDFPAANMMVQQAVADYTPFLGRTVERPRRENIAPLPRLLYHLTETQLIIVVDRPGQTPVVASRPLSRSHLRDKVEKLLRSLPVDQPARGFRGVLAFSRPVGGRPAYQRLLEELYGLLILPIASHLPAPGDLLIIEPHDTLHLAPFAALRRKAGDYLGERYTLLLSPSQDALQRLRSYSPYCEDLTKAGVLVVGNPKMEEKIEVDGQSYGPFAPLPGAEREAAFIQRSFAQGQVVYLRGAEADLPAMQAAAEKSQVIHLATHGLADEAEPMSSFLLVAGGRGYVTAREIRNWTLSADLVVLSACETALGRLTNTEGVIGLARALLIAGARTVVVSLWPVHDEATALLMECFYRELLDGKNAPAALQAAQLELRKIAKYRAPVFWAGFAAMGCP